MNKTIAVAYIPALHRGYIDFLNVLERKGVRELYLIGDDILAAHDELDYINRKDRLRAVDSTDMVHALKAVSSLTVSVLDIPTARALAKEIEAIVVPAEDITDVIVAAYFPNISVERQSIFLRWNRNNVGEGKVPQGSDTTTADAFQKKVLDRILAEAEKSSDWWRQVGAALVKDDQVLFVAHNDHFPESQLPNIIGDTRALFKKGVKINYVTTAHAEAALIAEAAKRGISTDGAELYVTDFPCPYCARMLAKSGIRTLYFLKGYAVLDGDEFLKGSGIEVVKVIL